jgi:uncharacterized protein with HEPN domain
MTGPDTAVLLARIADLEERLRAAETALAALRRGLTIIGEATGMEILSPGQRRPHLRVLDGGRGGAA